MKLRTLQTDFARMLHECCKNNIIIYVFFSASHKNEWPWNSRHIYHYGYIKFMNTYFHRNEVLYSCYKRCFIIGRRYTHRDISCCWSNKHVEIPYNSLRVHRRRRVWFISPDHACDNSVFSADNFMTDTLNMMKMVLFLISYIRIEEVKMEKIIWKCHWFLLY